MRYGEAAFGGKMEPLLSNDAEVQGSQGIHRVDAVRAEGIRAAARVLVVLLHLDQRFFGFVRSGQRVGAGRPQRIERRPLHLHPKLEILNSLLKENVGTI